MVGARGDGRRLDRGRLGWNGVFVTMVACCVLTIVFSAMTPGRTAESGTR